MMKEETDIAIIGAGPAGLIAAREAARRGTDVIVLEEHGEIGVPRHCAGLLSIKGLTQIRVSQHEAFVQNKVKGARFFSPSKLSFTVERDAPVACVVNRTCFDQFLAMEATHAGANLRLNSKVQGIRRRDGKIILRGDFGEIKADIIVDAEGLASHFVGEIGLQPLKVKNLLPALQYDLTGISIDPDYVEVHTGQKLAPKFFAWIIPLNEDSVRAGLACKGTSLRKRLELFIRDRFKGENPIRVHVLSGRIVTSGPIPRTFHDNFIVVGDAAGQAKPTTGGGVIWGGICAMIAGETAAEAVNAETFSQDFLRNYETRWREKLGKEVRLTLLARKILNKISDKTIDRIFESVKRSNLHEELSAEGDIDFQAASIIRFIKKREIFKVLVSSINDFINWK